ncbi:MAG: hypothetical protein U5L08_06665 [Xanthomonadales bacterium]|nr:hypothetical protein [Xanthomonadales bacterium]
MTSEGGLRGEVVRRRSTWARTSCSRWTRRPGACACAPATGRRCAIGETVGLETCPASSVVLFDPESERALASDSHPGGPRIHVAREEAASG